MTSEPLRCQQVVEELAGYLEGAIEAELGSRIREHLAGCGDCTRFLAQLELTISLVGGLPSADEAGELDPAVRQAVLREFQAVLG